MFVKKSMSTTKKIQKRETNPKLLTQTKQINITLVISI